jgi:hypothetical protein
VSIVNLRLRVKKALNTSPQRRAAAAGRYIQGQTSVADLLQASSCQCFLMGPIPSPSDHKKNLKKGQKFRAHLRYSKARRLAEKQQIEALEHAASQFVRRTFAVLCYHH